MIKIIDYGCGNLESLSAALTRLDCDYKIVETVNDFGETDGIILPGVGHFGYAVNQIDRLQFRHPICELVQDGVPILGICLGMQLLFEKSEEAFPTQSGLGLIEGSVVSIRALGASGRIPHIGWNTIEVCSKSSELLRGIESSQDAYFVHSFAAVPVDPNVVVATTDYEVNLTAIVEHSNVFGTQFHPEKSSTFGAAILRNFTREIC